MQKNLPSISLQPADISQQNDSSQIIEQVADILSPKFCKEEKKQEIKYQNEVLRKEKQKQYDAKYKKKKKEKQGPSILDEAKQLLKNNDLNWYYLKDQEIWPQLNDGDRKSLRHFFDYEKKKTKKVQPPLSDSPGSNLKITQEQHKIISTVQLKLNELIYKELNASQTIENQIAVLVRHHCENHFTILNFLESLQKEPFQNFFEVLIGLIQQTTNTAQQTDVLVGLCGIYNGQKVDFSDLGGKLCCSALTHLAYEIGVTSQQVIGFLKFIFVTNSDIHNTDLQDLVQFDKRHEQCFNNFKQWLEWTYKLPPHLIFVLPNSCRLLGLPFAKQLQTDYSKLIYQVPPDLLQLFIEILVFSFERTKEPFKYFLSVAQCGFLELLKKTQTSNLFNLLNGLVNEIRAYNKQWYPNISNSSKLIEGALTLVKENKILLFDTIICKNLLQDMSSIDEYLARPSIIKRQVLVDEKQMHLQNVVAGLNNKNVRARKFLEDFDISLPLENLEIFVDALQISPHYIQELAMQILSQVTYSHTFLTIAPGLGKTKLILALAIHFAKQKPKIPVIILNTNSTLLARDYEQAKTSLEKFNMECASTLWEQPCYITFLTTQNFVTQRDLPEKYHIILDEYQNIFFNNDLFDILNSLQKAVSFTGFSGSSLTHMQCKLLECCFPKQSLVLQLTKPLVTEYQDEITICKNQKHHVDTLAKIAERFKLEVPQLFILDAKTAGLLANKRKAQYNNLIAVGDSLKINTTLESSFNQRREDGTFGSYILNEEMGTGTDPKTSTEIENNGGLVLTFGVKPSSISAFEQLNGRVGRIFNKGRRFYIINDPENYNECHKDYLKKQLNILRQKEDEFIRALLNKVKAYWKDQGIVEDEEEENSCGDNDSFESEQDFIDKDSDIAHLEPIQSLSLDKKRVESSQKIVSAPKNKQNIEECKISGEPSIDPYGCKECNDITVQQTIQEVQNIQVSDEVSSTVQGKQEDLQVSEIKDELIQSKIVMISSSRHKSQHSKIQIVEKSNTDCDQIMNSEAIPVQKRKEQILGKRPKANTDKLEQESKELFVQKKTLRQQDMALKKNKAFRTREEMIDERYQANYSKIGVHDEMLNDVVRVTQYETAIMKSCKDKSVLDLGSGSAILSAFAIKAGAKGVIAVDSAKVVDIMKAKRSEDELKAIKFINDTIENIALKNNKEEIIPNVDILVSEWMGYNLLQENMIGSFTLANRTFLKPDGIMIPSQAIMYLDIASIDATGIAKKHFKTLKSSYYKVAKIECCKIENLLSDNSTSIKELDFTNRDIGNPLDGDGFTSSFQIKVRREGIFNVFVGSFSVKLYEEVFLNTTPNAPETHWKQSLFFIKPVQVDKEDIVEGTVHIKADEENYRNLHVRFTHKVVGKKDSQSDDFFTFEE